MKAINTFVLLLTMGVINPGAAQSMAGQPEAAKSAAPKAAKEGSTKSASAPKKTQAPPDVSPLRLYEKFIAQQALAAKGENCIRSKTCASDESDYLRHAEAAYLAQKELHALAKKGNLDAAYLSGFIAYEEAKRFDEEFKIYFSFDDAEYRKSATRFSELSRREIRAAKAFLFPAAKAMKPEACYLLGEVLEFDQGESPKNPAGTYYYCAAREWHLKGQRDLAMRAYAGMRRTTSPQDPMIVEMHAKLLDDQPFNPWRQIEPRSSAAPTTTVR